MGKGSKGPLETDVLQIDDETSNVWLSNQIEIEAGRKKKRNVPEKTYDETDVCIVGLERIIAIATDDSSDDLTIAKIDSQLKLARMYHERFYESMVARRSGLSAAQMVAHTTKMDRIDRLYNYLLDSLTEHKRQLIAVELPAAISIDITHVSAHEHQVHDVRVKEVDIQRFSGDLKKWP